MALVYPKATISPTKAELLGAWLPRQSWSEGATVHKPVGSYRFDDPAGEVGMEAFVVAMSDGATLHVPCSYRGAPLAGAEEHLIVTMEHSVLGPRWIYDATADPVWADALATTITTGAPGVDMDLDVDGERRPHPTTAQVQGTGDRDAPAAPSITAVADESSVTVTTTSLGDLVVVRRLGAEIEADDYLMVRWSDTETAIAAGLRSGS